MERQQLVGWIEESYPKVSHSRACRLIQCDRNTQYYKKKMPGKDREIRGMIEDVMGTSRKGREKVIRLVRREHPEIGASRIRRVYELYGYSLTKKYRRRMKDQGANPLTIPTQKNQEWAVDFMSDSLSNGLQVRTFNVVDHYDRSCKGIKVRRSIPAVAVTAELDKMIELYGKPMKIRTDNGPEFRSKKFQCWLTNNAIEWNPIQKGKPAQNGIIERFNRTYREDVLDAHEFEGVEMMQRLTDEWIEDYNEHRPHQSLGYLSPNEYTA